MLDEIDVRIEITNLARGGRAALIQASRPLAPRLVGMRFISADDHPTEGQFRAAVADALAQLLDETL